VDTPTCDVRDSERDSENNLEGLITLTA